MLQILEKNRGIAWFITILIALFIFYMSSQTFQGGGGTGLLSYIYHLSIFFLLAFFLLIASLQGKLEKEILFISMCLAIVYGISDELHQYFTPGRYPDLKDVLLNSVGVLSASVLYILLIIRRKLSLQPKHFIQNNAENN